MPGGPPHSSLQEHGHAPDTALLPRRWNPTYVSAFWSDFKTRTDQLLLSALYPTPERRITRFSTFSDSFPQCDTHVQTLILTATRVAASGSVSAFLGAEWCSLARAQHVFTQTVRGAPPVPPRSQEHRGAYALGNKHFPIWGVHTQQGRGWVMWQLYS